MNSLLLLIIVLVLSSLYGIFFKINQGKMKTHNSINLSKTELKTDLGKQTTLVLFSSVFCMPCKATRVLLQDISSNLPDLKFVEIDAESNLDLVRKLKIMSTPTTLVLDSSGNEIGRAVGAPKREQVLDAIAPISI